MKSNNQDSDEKMMKLTEDFKAMIAVITDQMNTLKSSLTQKDLPKPLEPTTVVPTNRRSPPLDGRKYTKIGGMWTLKHEIRSTNFYKLLIRKELKGDTSLDLNNFYATSRCVSMR